MIRRTVAPALLAFVFGACDSSPPVNPDAGPPPAICKTPGAAAPIHFTDVTSDVGLDGFMANSVIAADFDGDGWSDIVITTGWSQAGNDPKGNRVRHLLLNRSDPNDPTKRTFVDFTDASGILASPSGTGERGFGLVNAGDLNDDGFVDLITCPEDTTNASDVITDGCTALLNDGKAHFALADASALGSKIFWVPSAALLDYDRDGVLDFWPGTIAHWPYPVTPPVINMPPTLFRGNGDGTFANVSQQVGLPIADGKDFNGTTWRHVFGVTACDIDGDGDDDMIFADYGRQENQVWLNEGGTFKNVAHDLGLDYDDNLDYTDDQSYRCWCQNNPNAGCPANTPAPFNNQFCTGFYAGDIYGRGWEPGVTDQPYNLGGNNFTIACGDIDDDGDMDLMSATIVHGDVGGSSDPSELIINPGTPNTKFLRPGNKVTGLDRPETGYLWNHGDNLVMFVDVDLDGRKDIFLTDTAAYDENGVPQSSHNYLWHQKSDGTFEEVIAASGLLQANKLPHLEGPAFVDIDGDGDLDMIVGDANTLQVRVFRNDGAEAQNWSRIRLVGAGAGAANTSAIGAVVKVTAGGRTQTQYVNGGFGHGNYQSDLVLTFGLGGACTIDSIDVRWPDSTGSHTTFTGVEANYEVTLKQADKSVTYKR